MVPLHYTRKRLTEIDRALSFMALVCVAMPTRNILEVSKMQIPPYSGMSGVHLSSYVTL